MNQLSQVICYQEVHISARFIPALCRVVICGVPVAGRGFFQDLLWDPAFIDGMVSRLKVARLEGGRSLLSPTG